MTSPLLHLYSVSDVDEPTLARVTLDCPAPGVVIVDVCGVINSSPTPLHWRAGDWTKPPLDVALNEQGAVESIQFVFQDESVKPSDIRLSPGTDRGQPIFDVYGWPPNRYRDVHTDVSTVRLASGELLNAFGDLHALGHSIQMTPNLRFILDTSDLLVGIAIGPLTEDQWQLIDAVST